jgi:hypothetical protein
MMLTQASFRTAAGGFRKKTLRIKEPAYRAGSGIRHEALSGVSPVRASVRGMRG